MRRAVADATIQGLVSGIFHGWAFWTARFRQLHPSQPVHGYMRAHAYLHAFARVPT